MLTSLIFALMLPQTAKNPIIWADVPDIAIIRAGDTYYMSSTTMHMSPGLPIMKSRDLVDWKLVSYAYETLEPDSEALNLQNGKNAYGKGSWASSLRHHKGTYYATTFSSTTGKTYIYSTKNIERGPWKKISFAPSYHDHSLFFDDDGRAYLIYGVGDIRMVELKPDLTGILEGGFNGVIVKNASAVAGGEIGLRAEGSQLFKVNGKYYLCNITWPKGGMRTQIIHRADKIEGPYEGRVMYKKEGIAQGGLIDTPDGQWYAYLFGDRGAVGRIPYVIPMKWEDGWPVLDEPAALYIPAPKNPLAGTVSSDEFRGKKLGLAWQWNHNPDPTNWSLVARPGHLRLTTSRVDKEIVDARNTLTQRTFGPQSSATVLVDAKGLRDGDIAGLVALAGKYGFVGVQKSAGEVAVVMASAENGKPQELARVPVKSNKVHLRIDCDFQGQKDRATFYYSLDGKSWSAIGNPLKMRYELTHFMGYRFGLFNFATKEPGGYADFDFYRISDQKLEANQL